MAASRRPGVARRAIRANIATLPRVNQAETRAGMADP